MKTRTREKTFSERLSHNRRTVFRVPGFIALTFWVGCSATGVPAPAPPPVAEPITAPVAEPIVAAATPDHAPRASEEELNAIDVALAGAVDRYTQTLEAYSREEVDRSALDVSFAEIERHALVCEQLVGCGPDRIRSAYARIVRLNTAAIETERVRNQVVLDAPDTAREPGTTPFHGEMPDLDRSVSLLEGADFRNLIELNGPVNAALDDWLTWLRPAFVQSYRNYLYLRPEIAPVYDQAALPEALLFAMIATETRGKVHSTSSAGAAGLLQFMPATGRIYGLRDVDGFDQRFDPVAATRANVSYLKYHFDRFNRDLELVLAAYNGGEGRVANLHRRYSGSSLWDERVYYALPRETRDYVPRVLAAAWLFLHPEDYGLELPTVDPHRVTMTIMEPIALDELAICLGQEGNPDGWFRTLRNLNPRLGPGERVPAGESIEVPVQLVELYQTHCQGTEILSRARILHDANYPAKPRTIPYTVRRGDTLSRIASRYRCADIRSLARMNRLSAPRYTIREGQRLNVPTCGS